MIPYRSASLIGMGTAQAGTSSLTVPVLETGPSASAPSVTYDNFWSNFKSAPVPVPTQISAALDTPITQPLQPLTTRTLSVLNTNTPEIPQTL